MKTLTRSELIRQFVEMIDDLERQAGPDAEYRVYALVEADRSQTNLLPKEELSKGWPDAEYLEETVGCSLQVNMMDNLRW